ncbi:MAG: hypothetical protein AB7E04_05820 [Desulfobacteraceae bacterium]
MKTTFRIEQNSPEQNPSPSGLFSLKSKDPSIKPEDLPFFGDDCTVGIENELQASCRGNFSDIDICTQILESPFFKNMEEKTLNKDISPSLIKGIENLYKKENEIYENSFVKFPLKKLTPFAKAVFFSDLRSDRNNPKSELRTDKENFFIKKGNETFLRIPISYLLKIAVADSISFSEKTDETIRQTGEKVMRAYLNDNTSPELVSFYVSKMGTGKDAGKGFVKETLKRLFLTNLLIQYSNKKFELEKYGQTAMIYFASHTPLKQKKLNELIPDSFYRKLFMSPCLSGWRFGEEKYQYMSLCHEVLSRSQLNAVKKLKDCQIIQSNLVVLPNTSNTCLANNGTHISTGSMKLTKSFFEKDSLYDSVMEKNTGDLVTKIFEHFVPLFINTYSASPYRMDFTDFHPEKALGFLPHQLDYTHLRMFWKNWKSKAKNSVFSRHITPFGPEWLDFLIKKTFRFKGDFIPDIRLLDYFVSVMSSPSSPCLDGQPGNQKKLLEEISNSGIFNEKMPLYLLFRTRESDKCGFSGFEARFYSTFENFNEDMRFAQILQAVITSLAYKYILEEKLCHKDIPDTVFTESERRQPVFCEASGISSFYVKQNTTNKFLKKILSHMEDIKTSSKYKGYFEVKTKDYKNALLKIIKQDAKPIIKEAGLDFVLKDLESRLKNESELSASSKMTKSVMENFKKKSPIDINSADFNESMEDYYRHTLRLKHLKEAWNEVIQELKKLELISFRDRKIKKAVLSILKNESPYEFLEKRKKDFFGNSLTQFEISKLISLMLIVLSTDLKSSI